MKFTEFQGERSLFWYRSDDPEKRVASVATENGATPSLFCATRIASR